MRVNVDGRTLSLSNLDKELYPDGTTKAEIIDYYTRIAPHILPHLKDRQVTRKRFPHSAGDEGFFEKNAPAGVPRWVEKSPEGLVMCQDLSTLVWLANLAALELHTPQWKVGYERQSAQHGPTQEARQRQSQLNVAAPDHVVFDLDPGEPAGLDECRAVALVLRDRLATEGLDAFPKTSGKKGMQVSCRATTSDTSGYAKAIATEFAKAAPDLITDQMDKKLRRGKVFIDWSQNNPYKTTICVYSLRAGYSPTVSAPLTWDEVADGAFTAEDFTLHTMLDRLEELGDLHEGLVS